MHSVFPYIPGHGDMLYPRPSFVLDTRSDSRLETRSALSLQVGSYDPMPNDNREVLVGLNIDRIK